MAITHGTAARTALATAILGAIDVGTAGKLVFQTSGEAEAATLTLSATSGSVSGAVLTFAAITSDTDATGGTVDRFEVQNSSSTAIMLGSVGTSGEDINLSSLAIGAGDTVSVSSFTYTASA
tara:strand:- start:395 stop:760 length:366 start_codon:yes stop_codon:yes gene_type:complete